MYPLTNELKHGGAWAIRQDPSRLELLAAHLRYLYTVQDAALGESAEIWDGLKRQASGRPHTERCQIPDVTDLLSTLDWMIREQSSFGPVCTAARRGALVERRSRGREGSGRPGVVLLPRDLRRPQP